MINLSLSCCRGTNEAGCSEASKFICLNAGPSTKVLGSAFHGCVGHEPLGVRVSTGGNLEMLYPLQYKRIQQVSAMEPGSNSRWMESSSTFTLDFSPSRKVTDMFVLFINYFAYGGLRSSAGLRMMAIGLNGRKVPEWPWLSDGSKTKAWELGHWLLQWQEQVGAQAPPHISFVTLEWLNFCILLFGGLLNNKINEHSHHIRLIKK